MENILLHSTSLKDFRQIIGDLLDEKFQQFKPAEPQQSSTSEYMTRREVCDLLHISLTTLHSYSRDGTLKSYRIGGRVLYQTAEVYNSVQEIQSLKYKHR